MWNMVVGKIEVLARRNRKLIEKQYVFGDALWMVDLDTPRENGKGRFRNVEPTTRNPEP